MTWCSPANAGRQLSLAVRSAPRKKPCITRATKVLVLGGTGRVGSAAAAHLLTNTELGALTVVLAGRNPRTAERTYNEILQELGGADALQARGHSLEALVLDYTSSEQLRGALRGVDALLHTAGPYPAGEPDVLKAAIEVGVPVYVDLADPVEYLDAALAMNAQAADRSVSAVVCAGAFPGLSNVLAVECAARLDSPAKDVKFSYFTAGLGGSGAVNLLITNLGFGQPVWTLRAGRRHPQLIGGSQPEMIDFFFDEHDASFSLVGRRVVWAWPFPEVRTVGEVLGISGDSDVKMGTAPDIWNTVMGAMVTLLPRKWWTSYAFCDLLARFSLPMVLLADRFFTGGETHAMRVDVVGQRGEKVSAVQVHHSFRRCVGQSAAEFLVTLLLGRRDNSIKPGVYLPEQLASGLKLRNTLVRRLTSTQGTVTFRIQEEATKLHAANQARV